MPETRSWQVRWQSAQRAARAAARSAGDAARGAGHSVGQATRNAAGATRKAVGATRNAAGAARTAAGGARTAWRDAPAERRQTWRLTAGSAAVGLAVAAGAVVTAGPWEGGQRAAERMTAATEGRPGDGGPARDQGPPAAPPVLAALGAPEHAGDGQRTAPTGPGLSAVLEPLLRDRALGDVRTASVVDVATGREVFGAARGTAAVPASTIKIATAVAALSRLGADHRIETTAVTGPEKDGTPGVVLVGGGDPTLTARAPGKPADPMDTAVNEAGERPASLQALADQTARSLKRRGTDRVTLSYDTSAYTGPRLHPISPNENITPVTALMTDEGRLDGSDRGPAPRDTDPEVTATRAFADLLRDRGVRVDGDPRPAKAPKDAERLGTVRSLPLSSLVERMLTHSDNDLGEALVRQTAIAAGIPADFKGGQEAVRQTLASLGLPLEGAVFEDGSGLDRDDRASAELLTRLLALAASPRHPELRSVISGLPVAGFTGTLRGRYAGTEPGAGSVRAKTGTLTGVNTVAGTVVDADGRLLAFAFLTNGTTDAQGAEAALDRMTKAVSRCGCRG
ncbi:D-alanyl-D-alanine carboxypeptidase/D-alanyl-D-alanine-endopeptidase [Streptomyces sp. NPDC003077]|uniref:D-alanyl-D-alanine carboxypeptidase/D-alanyl-D-alanine endopeptidase n=1 Tax=Streptomyces sp. NPDC003077 TaxID=3154443 RepID=UPI0033A5C8BC